MVPAITGGGRSFRGAFLYYAHDKRRDGETVRFTTDRVAWAETVNLPTGDPARAWKIMAHTALAQGHLKAAAGTKATGRKLKKPVFAYSIAWHPGERPSKAQMMEAARSSLEAQGLEEHQAIILCHTDEPQAHVHIIVNRVHPATGKAATLSNSKLKLSQWAEGYERGRGKILCPQRVTNNARRSRGEFVRHPRMPRPVFEFNRATANDHLLREAFTVTGQRQQDALLHEIGRATKRSHARQWRGMKQVYSEAQRIGRERGHDPAEVRAGFLDRCAELRDTQERQRQELRTAWDTRNAERRKALAPFCDHETTRRAGRAYREGLIRTRYGDDRFGGPGHDTPKPD
jgi:Relaxase/Mobilisation nuclease domain